MISKKTISFAILFIFLIAGYWLGPQPSTPNYNFDLPVMPESPTELEQYISSQESRHKLKPDNEARIVWADSSHSKTEYAIVYLPGFSASQMEGDPIHRKFAK